MKTWPKDHKTALFTDIVAPLVDAVNFAYKLERQNKDKDVPYCGLPLTLTSLLAGNPQISERLTAGMLEYDEEDQGRSAIDVILGCAVQLGIEQGHRIVNERLKQNGRFLDMYVDMMKGVAE